MRAIKPGFTFIVTL